MLLIYLSTAWVAGIVIGLWLNLPLALISVGMLPLPLLLLRRHRKLVILASLCLFALVGGALHTQSDLPVASEGHLRFYNDSETVTIKGLVSQDPDIRDKTTHLQLSTWEIKVDGDWRQVEGTALLFVPRYPGYSYGDVLLVTGELETPPRFSGFDYADYLAREGIYSTMLYPEIEALETGQGFWLMEWIYSARNSLSQAISSVLPQPQASLAQGMILGIRGNIPDNLRGSFASTGTAHLLAISGLHLGIIAGIMLSIGLWLFGRRRYLYIWLALGAIWLYALMAGMQPPVVRGAIMASVFLTAELLGRQRSAITALTFAAAIMVGLKPQAIVTASFQMSFLAMAGLIFIFPPLRDWGRKGVAASLGRFKRVVPAASFLSDSFAITLAAIIAVWPVVAYHFGIVSLVGPLATLLALPALPGIIIFGALSGGLGLLALPVGQVIGWLAWLFLSYLLLIVGGFAALPLSHIDVGSFSPLLIGLYYATLAFILWLISRRQRQSAFMAEPARAARSGMSKTGGFLPHLPKKRLLLPLVAVVILASVAVANLPDNKLHISFLDVGQGDAILIQRGTQQVLIDGGPSPQAVTLELGNRLPFWDRTIELVIMTHLHADHLTGLVEVLDKYRVEQVLYPAVDYDAPIYHQWLRLLEEKDINGVSAQAGQRIDLGGVIIEVLNPQKVPLQGTESDIDNNGIVLRLVIDEVSFLLMSDMMWQGELELISQRAIPESTVLKVGHHGSETSTTAGFLAVTSPRLAVISVGANNDFGHPDPDILARLGEELGSENIYRTDLMGTIEFITDGKKLWLNEG